MQASDEWTEADEAEWLALHEAQYGVEPLGDFIARENPRFPPPKHLDPLIALLERTRHEQVFAIVSMPPRHRKTTTCANGLAWMLKNDAALSHAFITYNDRKARRESRLTRSIATKAGVRMDRRRQSLNEWGVLDANNQPAGCVWAAGWGGGLNGVGVTGVLLIDDLIVNRKQAQSAQARDDQWEWFTDVAITRLEPGASVIIVMTRWHEDDLIGRILDGDWQALAKELKIDIPEWEVINLPAICVDEQDGTGRTKGQALWPEQYGIPYLNVRKVLNPWSFEALYQGRPRPDSGQLFRDPMRYKLEDLLELGVDGMRAIISCDPAASDSDQACHWAATLLWAKGYGPDMRTWIVDVWREQCDPITGAEKLLEFQQKWGGVPIVMEGGTVGKSPISSLRRNAPMLQLIEVPPDKDKWTRAQPAAAMWNRGMLMIPLGVTWAQPLIKEAHRFTGNGSTEADQVDALAHGINFLIDQPDLERLYGPEALVW